MGRFAWVVQIHGSVDMIKLFCKNFFELEAENTGKYIVLSNAYAALGLWNNVESGIKIGQGLLNW